MPFIPAFNGLNFIANFILNDFSQPQVTQITELYQQYYLNLLNNTYYRLYWNDLDQDDATNK